MHHEALYSKRKPHLAKSKKIAKQQVCNNDYYRFVIWLWTLLNTDELEQCIEEGSCGGQSSSAIGELIQCKDQRQQCSRFKNKCSSSKRQLRRTMQIYCKKTCGLCPQPKCKDSGKRMGILNRIFTPGIFILRPHPLDLGQKITHLKICFESKKVKILFWTL